MYTASKHRVSFVSPFIFIFITSAKNYVWLFKKMKRKLLTRIIITFDNLYIFIHVLYIYLHIYIYMYCIHTHNIRCINMMRNEYVIESNRYESHTIAAKPSSPRNPFKYIILKLFFQLWERSMRTWSSFLHVQKDDAVAKRRRSAKKTQKEKANISSLFSDEFVKSLLGKKIPGPGLENLAGLANRKIP